MWGGIDKLTKTSLTQIQGAVGNLVAPQYEEDDEPLDAEHQQQRGTAPIAEGQQRGAPAAGNADESAAFVNQLQSQLQESNETIQRLQNDNNVLKAMVRDSSGQPGEGGAAGDAAEVARLRAELAEEQERNASIIAQTEEYSQQVEASHHQTVAHFENLQAQRDEEYQQQIDALNQQLEAAQQNTNSAEELEQLAATNRLLQEQIRDRETLLESVMQERDAFRNELSETENDNQRKGGAANQADSNAAAEEVQKLMTELDMAKAQFDAEIEQLKRRHNDELAQRNRSSEEALEAMGGLQQRLDVSEANLRQARDAVSAQLMEAEQSHMDELGTLRQQLTAASTRAGELEAQLSSAAAGAEDAAKATALEAELAEVKTRLDSAEKEAEAANQSSNYAKVALQAAEEKLSSLSTASTAAEATATADAEKQLQEQQNEAAAVQTKLQHEIEKLRADLETTTAELEQKREAAISAAFGEEEPPVAAAHVATPAAESLGADAAALEAMTAERDSIQREVDSVRQLLADATKALEAATEEAENGKFAVQQAESNAASANKMVEELQSARDQLQKELDNTFEQIGASKRETEAAQQEVAALRSQAEEKESEDKLAAEKSTASEEASRQQEEAVAVLQKELDDVHAAETKAMSRVEELEAAGKESAATIEAMKGYVAQWETAYNGAKEAYERVSGELETANAAAAAEGGSAAEEVLRLSSALKQAEADKTTAECALSELKTVLAEKEAAVPELQQQLEKSAGERDQVQADLTAAQTEVAELKKRVTEAEEKAPAAPAANDNAEQMARVIEAEAKRADAEKRSTVLAEEITTLNGRVAALQEELQGAIRGREVDKSTLMHGQSSMEALKAQRDDLEGECTRFRELTSMLHRTCVDALLKVSADIPPSASFSDSVSIAAQELLKKHEEVVKGVAVQQQWASTYEQAKSVNQATSDQLMAARQELETMQGETAARDVTLTKLRSRVDAEGVRANEAEVALQQAKRELATLQEAAKGQQDVAAQRQSDVVKTEERVLALNSELEDMRSALAERDAEITAADNSVRNLQSVLEAFQAQKSKDIEEATAYLNHEQDLLRAQIASLTAEKEKNRDAVEAIEHSHRKDIAQKNLTVSALQNKLAEMRKALEETVVKMNDDQLIDKRVVSQLLVNYIHSVIEERGDSDDIIRVMSGLLTWDEDLMERAGLIPGPQNPIPKQHKSAASTIIGGVGGVIGSFWGGGGGGAGVVPPSKAQGQGGAGGSANSKSLAAAWVDFLIAESEQRSNSQEQGEEEQAALADAPAN